MHISEYWQGFLTAVGIVVAIGAVLFGLFCWGMSGFSNG